MKGNIGKKWVKVISSQCFTKISLSLFLQLNKNQSVDLQNKSNDWFLYDLQEYRKHETSVKHWLKVGLKRVLKKFFEGCTCVETKSFVLEIYNNLFPRKLWKVYKMFK